MSLKKVRDQQSSEPEKRSKAGHGRFKFRLPIG
jgi:hypothetical protein